MKRIVILLMLAATPALAQPKAASNPFMGNQQAVAQGGDKLLDHVGVARHFVGECGFLVRRLFLTVRSEASTQSWLDLTIWPEL